MAYQGRFDKSPDVEFVRVLGAGLKLSIVTEGKTYLFQINRRQLLCLLESGFEALKELEPDSER